MADSLAASHVANGVNLLFPAGERFFVRSVRHYVGRLTGPEHAELAEQVKGFFGQEGRHAQAHERYFETLRAQGYDIDAFLGWYERVAYEKIEKMSPPALRLAATVALEHFTAIMAEDALSGGALDAADPTMRDLLSWHALEELEHKAVAFDVLCAVFPSPVSRYPLRVAGLFVATTVLGAFWAQAARELLAQDDRTLRDAGRELSGLRGRARASGARNVPRPIFARVFLRGILGYLRPGFHPKDDDHGELVARSLERLVAVGVVPPEASGERAPARPERARDAARDLA